MRNFDRLQALAADADYCACLMVGIVDTLRGDGDAPEFEEHEEREARLREVYGALGPEDLERLEADAATVRVVLSATLRALRAHPNMR